MSKRISHFPTTLLSFAFLSLIFFITEANAATFTVTNINDAGAGSLRQAVIDSNNAAGSDTIMFSALFDSAQTIQLASAIFVSPGAGNSLTITGPGMNLLTVRGSGAALIFSRNVNDANSLLISDMTLTNAVGGAVNNPGANLSLTVTNVAFDSNTSTFGGAIANAGQLFVTGSTFTGNTATGANGGGAIYTNTAVGTSVTISNSTFGNNSAAGGSGGAIRVDAGPLGITGSTFTSNSAGNSGGAISSDVDLTVSRSIFTSNTSGAIGVQGNGGALSNSGAMTISGTTITGNSATADGGAIYTFFAGARIITNSTISNNTANADGDADGEGGGIYIRDDSGMVTITGSTVSGNQAGGSATGAGNGGGIYSDGPMTLSNSTVSGNIAGRNCAGVFDGSTGGSADIVTIESSTIVSNEAAGNTGGFCVNSVNDAAENSVHNTIIADNTAGGASQDISGSVNSLGYNLFETIVGATIGGSSTGNITGQDPLLGALANNGGPTLTHALQPGSPAVDVADPVTFPATDQRGVARPLDGDASGGARADIGSFEKMGTTAADVTVTGRVLAANGRAISGAILQLRSAKGEPMSVRTNTFGYFQFKAVAAGESYLMTVSARGYNFAPMFLSVNDNIDGLIITPTGRR